VDEERCSKGKMVGIDVNLPVVIGIIIDGLIKTGGGAVAWIGDGITLSHFGRCKSGVGASIKLIDLLSDIGGVAVLLGSVFSIRIFPLRKLVVTVTESAGVADRVGSPKLAVQATEGGQMGAGGLICIRWNAISTTAIGLAGYPRVWVDGLPDSKNAVNIGVMHIEDRIERRLVNVGHVTLHSSQTVDDIVNSFKRVGSILRGSRGLVTERVPLAGRGVCENLVNTLPQTSSTTLKATIDSAHI